MDDNDDELKPMLLNLYFKLVFESGLQLTENLFYAAKLVIRSNNNPELSE